MTAHSQITDPAEHVNVQLASLLEKQVATLFLTEDLSGPQLEQAVWEVVLEVGRLLLTGLLA